MNSRFKITRKRICALDLKPGMRFALYPRSALIRLCHRVDGNYVTESLVSHPSVIGRHRYYRSSMVYIVVER